LDSDSTHTGYGQQKNCHQFCPKDTAEYTGCPVKVHQYPVYDIQIQMPGTHTGIAVHINVDYQNKNTDCPAEFHNLGKGSQIVFLLHNDVDDCGGNPLFPLLLSHFD